MLEYATPRSHATMRFETRVLFGIFACLGLVFNVGMIGIRTQQLHESLWVYHDLKQDSKAYGRPIAPATIARLADRTELCIAAITECIATAFGALLAIHLLQGSIVIGTRPELGFGILRQYRRFKPAGAVLTAAASWWAGQTNLYYWVSATNHMPIGAGGPPIISTAVLLFCALTPWWLLKRETRGT